MIKLNSTYDRDIAHIVNTIISTAARERADNIVKVEVSELRNVGTDEEATTSASGVAGTRIQYVSE